jgi:endonuclease YncB( thermonuclease family)
MPSDRAFARQLGKLAAIAAVILAVILIERYFGGGDESTLFGPRDRIEAPDGDTLRVDGTEYRIFGIDAPELHQACEDADGKTWRCGRLAQTRLKALVARGPVTCVTRSSDRFGRHVATCCTEAVPDLGETLVREGLAINLGGRVGGPYEGVEAEAQAAKRGIWQGRFERPSDWRQANPRTD